MSKRTANTQTDSGTDVFQDENYRVPVGNFMKFEDGDNKFRILSKIVTGWKWWDGETNHRVKTETEIPGNLYGTTGEGAPRHFWAMAVWNYNAQKVQVLEIHQITIIKAIKLNIEDEGWGDPRSYDIKVHRKNNGGKIEFVVKAMPHSEKPETGSILERINLSALFEGGNVFAPVEEEKAPF